MVSLLAHYLKAKTFYWMSGVEWVMTNVNNTCMVCFCINGFIK